MKKEYNNKQSKNGDTKKPKKALNVYTFPNQSLTINASSPEEARSKMAELLNEKKVDDE